MSMNTRELGQAIRSRRRELGISQRALAEIAGVSLHTLSDIESGKANPTLATVVQLLQPLGFELDIHLRAVP